MTMSSTPGSSEPKNSAAVIILSNREDPEVLLVRRNPRLKFMAGHHVFPGGRIDANEGSAHVIGASSEIEAVAIHAAAREAFEEAGILLVAGRQPPTSEIREGRREHLAGIVNFDQLLDRFDLTIDAAQFHPAGVWITPKGSPIRFHSRYYLFFHDDERYEELIDGEIDHVEWLRPAEARRLWREGKLMLPPPVAYALQQLATVPFPQVLEYLKRTTHVEPETPSRIEYRCGINVLPLRTATIPPATGTNCIVVGERELYVIDPATSFADEQVNLKTQLDLLCEHGARIAAALLTHSHPDHTGAAEFVREQYGAPIWAHEATARQVSFKIDRFLDDDELIEVAGSPPWVLRCIHTPGHDPGHLCFLEEMTHTLIAGDMIAEKGTIIISRELQGDMTEYLASLERLLQYDADLMLPAHGLAIANPHEKVREFIHHRLQREAKIKAALDAGLTETKDILASAYSDVPQAIWPLAEKSLEAHIFRLRELAKD